ncbi:hypothetical protein T09_67 [Trichinella sp. T9]|nr:hypothetical protein T09_67 [Trichinella sp. T9]
MGPSSLLFPNFSYILILFLEKNRFYENFEISWAIDFAVFAFWRVFAKSHWTQSDSCGKIAFKIRTLYHNRQESCPSLTFFKLNWSL